MPEVTILKTPELSFEQLGITEMMTKYTTLVRRDVWLVLHQAQSLRPYGPPVFKSVRGFYEEAPALALVDAQPPGLRQWYHVVKGFTWEAREVWIANLPEGG